LLAGDGATAALVAVAEPGIPECRGLGERLPRAALAAGQRPVQVLLLSGLHRRHRRVAARTGPAGAAPRLPGRRRGAPNLPARTGHRTAARGTADQPVQLRTAGAGSLARAAGQRHAAGTAAGPGRPPVAGPGALAGSRGVARRRPP